MIRVVDIVESDEIQLSMGGSRNLKNGRKLKKRSVRIVPERI